MHTGATHLGSVPHVTLTRTLWVAANLLGFPGGRDPRIEQPAMSLLQFSSVIGIRAPSKAERCFTPVEDNTSCCLVTKLCVQLFYNPMDCSLPGSAVHGVFQARIQEWVAISVSRESLIPTQELNPHLLHHWHILYHWATWEGPEDSTFLTLKKKMRW